MAWDPNLVTGVELSRDLVHLVIFQNGGHLVSCMRATFITTCMYVDFVKKKLKGYFFNIYIFYYIKMTTKCIVVFFFL